MKQTNKFNAGSPGFLYSVVVFILTALATIGVSFPQSPEIMGQDLITTLSTGGIVSVIGIIVASLVFPIWNAAKKGFTWKNLWSSSLTWVGIVGILFSALALTGFSLPDGTAEQLVTAVMSKDWTALSGLFGTVIVPTFIRWLKDRNPEVKKN